MQPRLLQTLMVCTGYYQDATRVMRQCWLPLTEEKRLIPGAGMIAFGFEVKGATPGMMYRFVLSADGSQVVEDTESPPVPVGVYPDHEQVAAWTTGTVTQVMSTLGDIYTALNRSRRTEFKVILLEYLDGLGG